MRETGVLRRLRAMGPAHFPTGIRLARPRRKPRWLTVAMVLMFIGGNAINVALGWAMISGALDGKWYDFRDAGVAMGQVREGLDDRFASWVSYSVTALIGGVAILGFVGTTLLLLGWLERRILARSQIRRGPNRVGPYGLLQLLADAIKLIQKETVIPRGADRFLYFLPPVLLFVPLMLVWGPVPWAPNMIYLDLNVGVLYIIAVGSMSTLTMFLAGWSSNNHYALLGAMRTIAMMISYEIPQSIALLAVVIMAGSMNLGEIVSWQADHNMWLAALLPLGLFAFLFSATAELNRTPNDISEAESEIVAGFHTEYSGMKFGLIAAVELGNALAVAALVTTLFLGGWSLFGLEGRIFQPYMIFIVKVSLIYFLFIWLRGTLPRFRLDQLMKFAWQYLIPLTVVNVLLVAVEASILRVWEVPGIVSLGLFTLLNIALAVVLLRLWSRVLGYHPEREALLRPMLTTSVGGLKAARLMARAPAGRAEA